MVIAAGLLFTCTHVPDIQLLFLKSSYAHVRKLELAPRRGLFAQSDVNNPPSADRFMPLIIAGSISVLEPLDAIVM